MQTGRPAVNCGSNDSKPAIGVRRNWPRLQQSHRPGHSLLSRCYALAAVCCWTVLTAGLQAADGNRLTHLDSSDPYYVSHAFPKLTTPQWIGEAGVDAAVVLAIDDMRDPKRYEAFLRPILQRLKQIDGRAPVSIMTCEVDPADPQLQTWLAEGVSLEIHTIDHPCPLLHGGDLAKAKSTYDRCVDLMFRIPGNRSVAYRMPCCDSQNTVSPRAFAEIFNSVTDGGRSLQADTSVFQLFTDKDPELPQRVVFDSGGRERFRPYLPADRTFVNTIENYPYPYVIGRLCWEFPCAVPSDWSGQHRHGTNNPLTVQDWQAAIDATVVKQGTFNLVFHPHGWIRYQQVIELVDHCAEQHGEKVKFLTFGEAMSRINRHLLAGHPLRTANGQDNGVRVLDLDGDGSLDVVIGNEQARLTRLWSPEKQTWIEFELPVSLVDVDRDGNRTDAGVRFGVLGVDGHASLIVNNGEARGGWRFNGRGWDRDDGLLDGLVHNGRPIQTARDGRDLGVRLRDLDADGRCELILGNSRDSAVFGYDLQRRSWTKLPFSLPPGTTIVRSSGNDAGLRFVDVDEDGRDDVLFSDEHHYTVALFDSLETGWSRPVLSGTRPDAAAVPMIVRGETNNGAWVHSRHLWVQNEDTAHLDDLIAGVSFDTLLADVEPGPKPPDVSCRLIETRPGFRVELVAAEPQVQDPVALEWGPDGKLWVAEMADYPSGIGDDQQPGGRIRVLEDTDADGRYDRSTLFLDGVRFPNGVLPWRNGVLVTAAPDIFYAEDTDGDGRCDHRETLYTGFGEGNQQHRVNGLVWGLDNWVYCANGDSGGQVRSMKTGEVVDIRGRDLRIRPDSGALDLQTGQTQFGRCRDNWGNWFGCNNSNPLYHFALADQYIRRNPHAAPPNLRVPVSVAPGPAACYPVSRPLPRYNDFDRLNRFTSACSAMIYRDELFGDEFAGNSFVSEPVHNLVHREIVTPAGATFTSRRADDEQTSEFVRSRDNWFRPTMIKTGPDGALYIADMYRFLIEHPQYIPEEAQQGLAIRAGDDRGRIYRVFPSGAQLRPVPRLDRLSIDELVRALDSPFGWQRDTVQRMLVERSDQSAVPLLFDMLRSSARPAARLHALCTLDGLGGLSSERIAIALADSHAGVRRHAVRLAEPLLDDDPDLLRAVLDLRDDDPHVQMQVACSLGASNHPQAARRLAALAVETADRPYLMAAVLSSLNAGNVANVLEAAVTRTANEPQPAEPGASADSPAESASRASLGRLFPVAAGMSSEPALETIFKTLLTRTPSDSVAAQYAALADVLDRLDQSDRELSQLRDGAAASLRAWMNRLPPLFDEARQIALDREAEPTSRMAATRLLGREPQQRHDDLERLAELLVPQEHVEVQTAAIARLGQLDDPQVAGFLLSPWKTYGPAVRSRVLETLLSRSGFSTALLDAVKRGTVSVSEIDASRRERLLNHRNGDLRELAEDAFNGPVASNRADVLRRFDAAATLSGDAERGRLLFKKSCSNCHRLNNTGFEVGPDLAALKDKSSQAMLVAVLDPNRAVESKFVNYMALTNSGLTYSGLLTEETGASVTLLAPEGKRTVLLRNDIAELKSTGVSTMPEGLEKDLSPQDVADIMAYVRSGTSSPAPAGSE